MAAAGCLIPGYGRIEAERNKRRVLFDGKTLDGWIQVENSATSFSGNDILDLSALANSIITKTNDISGFLNGALDDAVRLDLSASLSPNPPDPNATRSALAKNLNKIISGGSVYEKTRFERVNLSSETLSLIHRHPHGRRLVELNRLLLTIAFPNEVNSVSAGWTVKDEAMASTGSGRGVIYTAHDYARFRLNFTMRHVSGNPDHQACVLIFCTRPSGNEVPLDALGGIQFQVPKGGHWDYRPGHNRSGGDEFVPIAKVSFDPRQWSEVEIVADAATGSARMAVAQPVGSKAVEVLQFRDSSAGRIGPIAWQMHNAGLFDEYRDVRMETNPTTLELILLK